MRLSQRFANIITSPDKQDAAAVVVAPKGYGKSYTCLNIAWATAVEITEIMGGRWEDYFPIDREKKTLPTVGVIEKEAILRVLDILEPHQIAVLDDVGVALNARTWMDKSNILVNDIMEMMRIDETLTLMSVMSQDYIDKVPREIAPFFIEIVAKNHAAGYNILKVHENKKHFRMGRMFYPYLKQGRDRVLRYVCMAPPIEIAQIYDKMRKEATARSKRQRIDAYLSRKDNPERLTNREKNWRDLVTRYGAKVRELSSQGLTPYKISQQLPVGRSAVEGILKRLEAQ